MGCQCNKKTDEEELNKDFPDNLNEEADQNKFNEEINFQQQEQEQLDANKSENINQQNEHEQEDEDFLEKLNEEKNAKYAEYPDKMIEIINKIRENPSGYADVIEDSIKYITEEPDKEDDTKTKLIF